VNNVNFMIGTISYLPANNERAQQRIAGYRKQLDWLESLQIPFEYYRVESDWCDEAREQLHTSLNLHSIVTEQHPPGYNRNLLLNELYKSDYDWLMCLDDDRRIYPMFNGSEFIKDLSTPKLVDLARRGYLITCTSPYLLPFKKENYAWPYKEENWYLAKEDCFGFLQIVFIPNLVKYGYKPIYFNGETTCLEGDSPEDLQFQLDWILAKHPVIRNKNIIMEEIGQASGQLSTLYENEDHRQAVIKSQTEWLTNYLKTKSPRKPELWSRTGVNRRLNPPFKELVPRSTRYEFTGRDLPRDKKNV